MPVDGIGESTSKHTHDPHTNEPQARAGTKGEGLEAPRGVTPTYWPPSHAMVTGPKPARPPSVRARAHAHRHALHVPCTIVGYPLHAPKGFWPAIEVACEAATHERNGDGGQENPYGHQRHPIRE